MHGDTRLEAVLRVLNHWPRFRLQLFLEGILVGLLSGTVISFFAGDSKQDLFGASGFMPTS